MRAFHIPNLVSCLTSSLPGAFAKSQATKVPISLRLLCNSILPKTSIALQYSQSLQHAQVPQQLFNLPSHFQHCHHTWRNQSSVDIGLFGFAVVLRLPGHFLINIVQLPDTLENKLRCSGNQNIQVMHGQICLRAPQVQPRFPFLLCPQYNVSSSAALDSTDGRIMLSKENKLPCRPEVASYLYRSCYSSRYSSLPNG